MMSLASKGGIDLPQTSWGESTVPQHSLVNLSLTMLVQPADGGLTE